MALKKDKPLQDSDIKASIAGYGQYYRLDNSQAFCQTDQYGRNKFHMCAIPGQGDDVCKKDSPPLTAGCARFYKSVNQTVTEEDFEEIKIVDVDSKEEAFCFRSQSPSPHSSGWCETDTNYYDFKGTVSQDSYF